MSQRDESRASAANASANTTHLLWVGRWIEVRKGVDGWVFKTGRDASDWLLS